MPVLHFQNDGRPYSQNYSYPDGAHLHSYPGDPTTSDGEKGFWSLAVLGDTAIVRIHSKYSEQERRATRRTGVNVDKFTRGYSDDVIQSTINGSRSICGGNDQREAVCYRNTRPVEYARSRPVARLLLNNGTQVCTGWRVGPNNNTLMTNEHCVSSHAQVQATEAWFGYETPNCTGGTPRGFVQRSGRALLRDNVELDFALFTIFRPGPTAVFGSLNLDARLPVANEQIYIPQHPAGVPKKLAIVSTSNAGNLCRIGQPVVDGRGNNTDMNYLCDTEGGSSGSPVLAANSDRVIGLHHFGTCPNRAVRIDRIAPLVNGFFLTRRPGVPSSFRIFTYGAGINVLSWLPNAEGGHYEVYKGTSYGGSYSRISTIFPPANSHTVYVYQNTYYKARSCNAFGCSGFSQPRLASYRSCGGSGEPPCE